MTLVTKDQPKSLLLRSSFEKLGLHSGSGVLEIKPSPTNKVYTCMLSWPLLGFVLEALAAPTSRKRKQLQNLEREKQNSEMAFVYVKTQIIHKSDL